MSFKFPNKAFEKEVLKENNLGKHFLRHVINSSKQLQDDDNLGLFTIGLISRRQTRGHLSMFAPVFYQVFTEGAALERLELATLEAAGQTTLDHSAWKG